MAVYEATFDTSDESRLIEACSGDIDVSGRGGFTCRAGIGAAQSYGLELATAR